MKRVSVLLGMVTGILNKQNDFTINLKEHGWYRDFNNIKILPSLIKANFPISLACYVNNNRRHQSQNAITPWTVNIQVELIALFLLLLLLNH